MFDCAWLGTTTVKYPLDLWIYQELIVEQRPQLIVETGTVPRRLGASTSARSATSSARAVSLGRHPGPVAAGAPASHLLVGSSIAPETVAAVHARAAGLERVFVILTRITPRPRPCRVTRLQRSVPVGGSMIVEDTNVNGHPVLPEHGPGPYEAVEAFLASTDAFVRDERSERFMCTANPGGFLIRCDDGPGARAAEGDPRALLAETTPTLWPTSPASTGSHPRGRPSSRRC